jgi:alpha-beta hydrolase superfamily lysophospholipase
MRPPLESTFAACDGLRLFERRWQPNDDRRAEVVMVHGFVEHGGRHGCTAEVLAARGYGVSITDLRGHGRSDGPRCFVRSFDQFLDDLDQSIERATGRAGRAPLFLFGHSLGGLVAALWCIRRQPDLAGLVLSAPVLQAGRQVFPWLRRLAKFGGLFFPRLRLVRMGCRNLSRDETVVRAFREDPLVFHGRFPLRTGAEILKAGERARAGLERVRTPLLVLHGTADKVSDQAAIEELHRRAESRDKTLKLYPGLFHEVLSEPEREQVLADMVDWMDCRVTFRAGGGQSCDRAFVVPPSGGSSSIRTG